MSAADPDHPPRQPAEHLLGLVGAGIGPSLSPPLHEREAAELGLRCRYRLWDLDELDRTPGEVLAAARAAGYGGLNVTHPCKQAVIAELDELSPEAAALDAVNTVVFSAGRAIGHNTDWWGFARALQLRMPAAALDRVVLLGAGGAGAAVAYALLQLGAGQVRVLDVDADRAVRLASALRERFGDRIAHGSGPAEALTGADGLVHATPTGMAAHPGLPLPAELLRPDLWVADIVYRPLETELLRTARARGCAALGGANMVVFQAAAAFGLFTGLEPDVDRMLRHFDELARAEGGAHV